MIAPSPFVVAHLALSQPERYRWARAFVNQKVAEGFMGCSSYLE